MGVTALEVAPARKKSRPSAARVMRITRAGRRSRGLQRRVNRRGPEQAPRPPPALGPLDITGALCLLFPRGGSDQKEPTCVAICTRLATEKNRGAAPRPPPQLSATPGAGPWPSHAGLGKQIPSTEADRRDPVI